MSPPLIRTGPPLIRTGPPLPIHTGLPLIHINLPLPTLTGLLLSHIRMILMNHMIHTTPIRTTSVSSTRMNMADHTMGLMMSIDHHLSHTLIHTDLPAPYTGRPLFHTDQPLIHTGLLQPTLTGPPLLILTGLPATYTDLPNPTLTGLLLPNHTSLTLVINMSLTLNHTRKDARVLHLLFLAV